MSVASEHRSGEEWIDDLRTRFPTERYVDRVLTAKMWRRSEPPAPPWNVTDVERALIRYLNSRIPGHFAVSDLRPLGGGGSKEQYRFTLTVDEEESRDLVVRLQPPDSIVETDRLREYQILTAMHGVIPVPRCYWVDPDGSDLGRPGLIYAYVDGVVRPPSETLISSDFELWEPKLRTAVGRQFIELLAQIATADVGDADLTAFDIPQACTTQAPIAGINWFERVWEEDRLEPHPLMTLAAQWLRDNAPPVDRISVVHGDYRIGNFLIDPASATITAVLDWELVRFGDRHEDLAWTMLPLFDQRDESGRSLVSGFFEREEFLRIYTESSGLPVDPQRLAYYQVFHYWRGVVMAYGSAQRCVLGRRTKQDLLLAHNAREAYVLLAALRGALAQYL